MINETIKFVMEHPIEIILAAHAIASIIVLITPTKKDDVILKKIVNFCKVISLHKKEK